MKSAVAQRATQPRPWLERAAWYVLLALVAMLPLTTSITRGLIGHTYAFTDDAYHLPKLMLLAVLLAVATCLWIVDVTAYRRALRSGPAFIALAVFASLVALSTAFGPEPVSSLFGVSGLMTGAVTWLLCIWMCVLLGQYLTGSSRVRELSWALLAGCSAVAVVALLQALGADPLGTPFDQNTQWIVSQGIATVGNPNFTGLLMVLPALVGVGLAVAASGWRRWVAAACSLTVVLAAFTSLTRAAWLGILVGGVLFVVLTVRDKRSLARAAGITAIAAAIAVALGVLLSAGNDVARRFETVSHGLDAFSSGRLGLWVDTLRVIAMRPLLGTGADHLGLYAYLAQKTPLIVDMQRFVLQDPHDLPLLVAGLFGLPAFIAFVALIVLAYRDAFTALPADRRDAPSAIVFCGWLAGMTGLLVAALMSVWTITAVFVLFVAVAVLASPGLQPVKSPAVSPVVAALAALLLAVSLYGASASFAAARHEVLAQFTDTQAQLQDALRLAPWDTGLRTDYYYREMLASRAVLTGSDAEAAKSTAARIDAELQQEIQRFPKELLFYRLRMDLYALSKGTPGYQQDKLLQAIDDGLRAFPNDAEFQQRRQQYSK